MTFEEIENSQTDVELPEPSAPEPSPQAPETAPVEAPKADAAPFHEHPRFKELVEEKNKYRQELDQYRSQLEAVQKRIATEQAPKPVDPVYEKLKGIDPEFADYIKGLKEEVSKYKDIESNIASMREQQFVKSAVSQVETLHSTNKVPTELRDIYNQQLDSLYSRGALRSEQDVVSAYNKIHESMSKMVDSIKRAERESYVAAKKTDAKAPAPLPKGNTVRPGAEKFSSDPYERKQQAIQKVLTQMRADKSN